MAIETINDVNTDMPFVVKDVSSYLTIGEILKAVKMFTKNGAVRPCFSLKYGELVTDNRAFAVLLDHYWLNLFFFNNGSLASVILLYQFYFNYFISFYFSWNYYTIWTIYIYIVLCPSSPYYFSCFIVSFYNF